MLLHLRGAKEKSVDFLEVEVEDRTNDLPNAGF
jgi:hypothetical protein